MNSFSVKDKRILVTGASSGIGMDTAISLAANGAKLLISGRNEERLSDCFKQLEGEGHQQVIADLASREDLANLVESAAALDGIFFSAGFVQAFPIKFIKEKQHDKLFKVNYEAPLYLVNDLFKAKKINAGASLVFMSSVSATFPHKGGALYSGSKAALEAFSKTIALEFAHRKIRSNCIAAAMVRTPMFDAAEAQASKEAMDKHGEIYPLGFGETEDVANAAIYLLSNASKWVTGTILTLDGGLTTGL